MKTMKWILAALIAAPAPAADFLKMEIGAPLGNLHTGAASAFASVVINNPAVIAAFEFQCGEPGTINALGFRYAVRTGTPPTYRISLQGVNGSGNPDGTIKGGVSPASKTFTPPADTSWDALTRLETLDNPYTCTRGEFLSVVIDYSSGTIDASNNGTFATTWNIPTNGIQSFPIAQSFNGASWTKSTQLPLFFYTTTAGKTYGYPIVSHFSTARSAGAESAMFFSLPTGTAQSYKVAGVRAVITTPAAAKFIKVVLYAGVTVLQSVTVDSDYFTSPGATTRLVQIWFPETMLATLSAGTTYRIGISPQDSSNNVALYSFSVHDTQAMTAFPGGVAWGFSSRTGCGGPCDAQTAVGWTDSNNVRPMMSLILEDVTPPPSTASASSYVFVK